MKKKACKQCKYLVDGDECPICKSNQFSTSWQGRLFILSPTKSVIAKKVGLSAQGEYAIKVR